MSPIGLVVCWISVFLHFFWFSTNDFSCLIMKNKFLLIWTPFTAIQHWSEYFFFFIKLNQKSKTKNFKNADTKAKNWINNLLKKFSLGVNVKHHIFDTIKLVIQKNVKIWKTHVKSQFLWINWFWFFFLASWMVLVWLRMKSFSNWAIWSFVQKKLNLSWSQFQNENDIFHVFLTTLFWTKPKYSWNWFYNEKRQETIIARYGIFAKPIHSCFCAMLRYVCVCQFIFMD